jgi:hypothetical protein
MKAAETVYAGKVTNGGKLMVQTTLNKPFLNYMRLIDQEGWIRQSQCAFIA